MINGSLGPYLVGVYWLKERRVGVISKWIYGLFVKEVNIVVTDSSKRVDCVLIQVLFWMNYLIVRVQNRFIDIYRFRSVQLFLHLFPCGVVERQWSIHRMFVVHSVLVFSSVWECSAPWYEINSCDWEENHSKKSDSDCHFLLVCFKSGNIGVLSLRWGPHGYMKECIYNRRWEEMDSEVF